MIGRHRWRVPWNHDLISGSQAPLRQRSFRRLQNRNRRASARKRSARFFSHAFIAALVYSRPPHATNVSVYGREFSCAATTEVCIVASSTFRRQFFPGGLQVGVWAPESSRWRTLMRRFTLTFSLLLLVS